MDFIEADTLPLECFECQEEDCYNCDFAGDRWHLSRIDELNTTRKMLIKSIERSQRRLSEINKELAILAEQMTELKQGEV